MRDDADEAQRWLDEALRNSRELAVLRLSPDGHIIGWHGAAERLFGYGADEICGRHFDTLFVADDRSRSLPGLEIEIARRTGSAEDDRWHLRKDGTRFWASGLLGRHCDAGGTVRGYVKLVRDRTDVRMRLESLQNRIDTLAAALQQRNEERLTLLHELRNPLAPLLSAARVLQQQNLPPATQSRMADVLQRQCELLKRLLEDAGAAGGTPQTRLELRAVVLQEALEAAVRGLREESERRGLALELIAPPVPVTLHADPEHLQQMLLNLLGNAMKYTPEGGHITVTATIESDMVLIRFDDDGVGVAPENVDRIFELFTREARDDLPASGGLGIGLAVVKRLASLHGGFIEARSAGPGKGAQFLLQLPVRPP